MATPDPDRYIAAQNGAVRLALRDLERFWDRMDHSDPFRVRQSMEGYWRLLIARYGEVAATLAVDRFEEITSLPGVMVRAVDPDRADARMRWAMGPSFGGNPAGSLALLGGLVDELVKQAGRSSFFRSVARHGLRVARVPVGMTCAWCLMLGSRGFDYTSKQSALRANHGDCDCYLAVEGEDTGDYDPDALYERYLLGREKADSGKPKEILSAMREIEDIH